MNKERNIRLYVDQKLASKQEIVLNEKASHYLCVVMRCLEGDSLTCFNQEDGEFLVTIKTADKKQVVLAVMQQLRQPQKEANIWLLFSPLKKDRTDFVIEKAVELGVKKIIPVITARTNNDKVKVDRYLSQAIEAKNQAIQEALKAENLVKQAEANAKIAIAKAEGEAKALRIQADGEAYYNRTVAASLNELLVRQDAIEKWDGKLPEYMGGNNIPMINLGNK